MFETKIDNDRMYVYNITDQNISDLIIPEYITNLEFCGQLSEYSINDHITDFWCFGLGLQSLKLNENLQWLVASNNCLTSLELSSSLVYVDLNKNILNSLTAKTNLTNIKVLDIRHNCFDKFDLLLPKNMVSFWIEGNPQIKIKYIDFIFVCDENDNVISIIDGDYKDILGGGPYLAQSEWVRNAVAQRAHTGQKYIDISKFAW